MQIQMEGRTPECAYRDKIHGSEFLYPSSMVQCFYIIFS